LLLSSGLRRLRQDLVNFISRLEGRRSIQLSYGRTLLILGYLCLARTLIWVNDALPR